MIQQFPDRLDGATRHQLLFFKIQASIQIGASYAGELILDVIFRGIQPKVSQMII